MGYKIEKAMSFIKTAELAKSAWEELKEFETAEAVETLKKCGITEGMTVLDIGCGHGHYTFPAAVAAGENGRVIAVDINEGFFRHINDRAVEYNMKNIMCLKANEIGLDEYKSSIDFIILYDILHGMFSEWENTTKAEFAESIASLLKPGGILSLALYSETEIKRVPAKSKTGKDTLKAVSVPHEEAVQPYIEIIQSTGLRLHGIVENGGVHFCDYHNPKKWREHGEIKISSLERRNIYNFIKQ
jgi:cyclopropane fatty-acyl-phospholipid synthase-like methyltransferase